jgi:hypothetical protein
LNGDWVASNLLCETEYIIRVHFLWFFIPLITAFNYADVQIPKLKKLSTQPLFRKVRIQNRETGEVLVIDGGDVSRRASPIAPLLEPVKRCVAWVVPERHDDLQALLDSGIGMELDGDSEDFYIGADVKNKKVVLGLAALERIWAYTYFYLSIQKLLEKHGQGVEIDLTQIPEIQPARGLAIWALKCETEKKQSKWPDGLPRPDKDGGDDEMISQTRPYFLNAVCFLILHEMGHIYHQHPTSKFVDRETSYKWEFEADAFGAQFMLRDWKMSKNGEKDFIGRCTGIALGLSLLAGVELYHHEVRDDHPTIAERLLVFF